MVPVLTSPRTPQAASRKRETVALATTYDPSNPAPLVAAMHARVGSLLARRHVNGATLAAMSRPDLVRPEPQGLGLAAADADKLFDLVKRLQALSPPS